MLPQKQTSWNIVKIVPILTIFQEVLHRGRDLAPSLGVDGKIFRTRFSKLPFLGKLSILTPKISDDLRPWSYKKAEIVIRIVPMSIYPSIPPLFVHPSVRRSVCLGKIA